jgi:hypothetical protein
MDQDTSEPNVIPTAEYHSAEDSGKSFLDLMDESFPTLDSEEAREGKTPEPVVKAEKKEKPAAEAKKAPPAAPAADVKPAEPAAEESTFDLGEADAFFSGDEDEPAAEAKAEEDFDEEAFDKQTEELSSGLELKAGEKFKSLRFELKEAKQAALQARPNPETEQELESLRLKAQELEGLKLRVEELSNVSAKAKLESDEDYRAKVLLPSSDIAASLSELATSYEIDPKVLKSIVATSDRKEQNALIEEYLVNFSELDRQEVYGHIREFRGIARLREEMMANAGKKLTEMEARKVEAEHARREDHRKNVQTLQKGIWEKYQKILPGLEDDDGEPNETYQKLVNRSMSIDFSKARGSDEAFAAFAGVALPHVIKQVEDLRAELAKYQKKEQRNVSAKPKLGSAPTPAPKGAGDTRSFVDRFADATF